MNVILSIKMDLYGSFRCFPKKEILVTITSVPARESFEAASINFKNLTSWVVESHTIQSKHHTTQFRLFFESSIL
jgi:hypothetical protein